VQRCRNVKSWAGGFENKTGSTGALGGSPSLRSDVGWFLEFTFVIGHRRKQRTSLVFSCGLCCFKKTWACNFESMPFKVPFHPKGFTILKSLVDLQKDWVFNPIEAELVLQVLLGGLEHLIFFYINWECHNPNWRAHIFQRARLNHQPESADIVDSTMSFPSQLTE